MAEEGQKPILEHPSFEVQELPSPNNEARPGKRLPDGIIIHSMGQYLGGQYDGKFAAHFLEYIGRSAHYLIDHQGKIYKCVPPEQKAYHAGKSKLGRQENLNSSFIGIELLIPGEWLYANFLKAIKKPDVFSKEHYDSCRWLCKKLIKEFDISMDRIVRHSDVSGPDVRPDPKYDPGDGFDWERFISSLAENSNERTVQ